MRHPPISWSLFVARLLLGFVLLVSGFAKIGSPDDAASLVIQVLPLSADAAAVFIYFLSAAESLCGLLLLFGKLIAPIALAVGLFLVTAIVYGAAGLSHPQPCGCFGTLVDSRTELTKLHWATPQNQFVTTVIAATRRVHVTAGLTAGAIGSPNL